MAAEPWILIFDNTDELDIINGFWPTGTKGSVFIPSQNPAQVRHPATPGAQLTPFAPTDCVRCLQHLGEKSVPEGFCKLTRVSEALDHSPLAFDQMAFFILETDCTIAPFQWMYSDLELADRL